MAHPLEQAVQGADCQDHAHELQHFAGARAACAPTHCLHRRSTTRVSETASSSRLVVLCTRPASSVAQKDRLTVSADEAISDRMAHLHLLCRCGPLALNRRRRLHRILRGHYRADEPPLDGVAGRVQEVCQVLPLCRRQLLLGGRPVPRRIFARNVLFKARPSVAPKDASGLLLCAGAVVAEQCLSCLNEGARPAALLALIPSPLRGHPASRGGSIAICASLRKMRLQPYCQSHARAFPTSYLPVQNPQIGWRCVIRCDSCQISLACQAATPTKREGSNAFSRTAICLRALDCLGQLPHLLRIIAAPKLRESQPLLCSRRQRPRDVH